MNMQMTREPWRDIRASLERMIMDGVLEPGAQVPTETVLARRYGAGRHSVRRAIAELAKSGHLSVEQGRGTFVQARPRLEYVIGPRTRLHRNMSGQGVMVTGVSLGSEVQPCSPDVARALGLDHGAEVVATRRLTLADTVPVSFGTIYHDASRFAAYPERREALGSTSAVYASYGITDYLRQSTEMYSRLAQPVEAGRLRQHPQSPVIVVVSTDVDMAGRPIGFSEVIWSAARVRFRIEATGDRTQ